MPSTSAPKKAFGRTSLVFFVALFGGFSSKALAEPKPSPPGYHQQLLQFRDATGTIQPVGSSTDWEKRRNEILVGMQAAMGPLPGRSQPKLPTIDIEGEPTPGRGYQRFTIRYDAEPGAPATAFLYRPTGLRPGERRPAILALHPTHAQGKECLDDPSSPYRLYARELAERGYVVIAPDYPSFGQQKDYDFARDGYDSGTMKGIVNHRRAIDVLETLPEVDPVRIATIGHSLGGHNALFVAAFEPRIRAVVTSCGWTPFAEYYGGKIAGWTSDRYMPRLRTEYGLDPEQVPFDFYEVLAAIAPRPIISISPERDANFDVAGVRKAIPEVAKVYALFDASEQLILRTPDAEHDFPEADRRFAYEFLDSLFDWKPIAP